MTQPKPREHLRDLIAARIRDTDCGHAIGPGHHGCAAACPSCIADAVVRLVAEAELTRRQP